jgi:transposase
MFAVELYAGISDRARQISCDFDMYKWRHLVETFFCDLKQFRRIATRHEKRSHDPSRGNPVRTQMNVNRPKPHTVGTIS